MSNCGFVDYINLSPNKTSPRNLPIDMIIIHCMAGNLSVESCGNLFANPSRQASSNYGIGSDGRIGMYVEECNRSWCTGGNKAPINGWTGSKIDHRAVTIEVANDTGEPNWHVSDKAMASLIKLCADICKRNNIKELRWEGNPNLVGITDENGELIQNLAWHRWFASKACPAQFLMDQHPYIVAEVNKLLNTEVKPQPTPAPTPTPTNDNAKIIWDYLMGKIGNEFGVAGLMGNLKAESNLRANNLQNSFEKSLGLKDDEYTIAVDNDLYTNFVYDKAGYGLAQWTYWSRKQNLLNFKKESGKSIGDLGMQLDFLYKELSTSYKGVLNGLINAKSVKEASDIVLLQFEKPKNQDDNTKNKRASLGQEIYDTYAGGKVEPIVPTPTPTPEMPKTNEYVVKKGDTLSKIARDFNTTVEEILKINPQIKNPNLINVGQVINILEQEVVEMYYTVKKGDTLTKIAQSYGTTVANIMALNPQITNKNLINIGQVIRVK